MVLIHVGVEIDDTDLAMTWVQEYFGCTSHGRSQEEALRLLPDALRAFWSWLRAHGEPDVPDDDAEIAIEQIEVCRVQSRLVDGDSEGFFSFDRSPLVAAEFQRALRYMAYARSDVVALAEDLRVEDLQQMVGRSDRSVRATLGHLAFADLWYAQRAGAILDGAWEIYLLERLRGVSVDWLQRSFDKRRGETVFSVGPDAWGEEGRKEIWTLAKALRRHVWHDLIHTRAMQRNLRDKDDEQARASASAAEEATTGRSRNGTGMKMKVPRAAGKVDMGEVVIVQRLGGGTLRIRHAAEMAQVFFRLDPSANGPKAYDSLVAQANRDRIEESDIHAINGTMAARSPLDYWTDLIAEDSPPWLAALDKSWSLLDLTDEEWTAYGVEAKLAAAFAVSFGRGRRLSVVTKVLHMKRPDLIPVCDALVLQQLGVPSGVDGDPAAAAALIGHLRSEGRRNLRALEAIQSRLKWGGQTPSLLRIFEALIWQSHPDVWCQKLAPLISEWLERPLSTADGTLG